MELNEKLSKFEVEREVVEDVERNQLKKYLSVWADSIPHHGLAKFGEQIEIISLKSMPSYVVTLKVQFEIRSLHEGTWPYQGKSIFPSRAQLNNKNEIWSVNLPLADDFGKSVINYSVSEKILTCDICKGYGKLVCDVCNGNREVICPECAGHGKVGCPDCGRTGRKRCSWCGGTGNVTRTLSSSENYRKIREACSNCHGQGSVPCSSCVSGWQTCPSCNGYQKVVCSRCEGNGFLMCGNCKGTGKLIYCLYLKDRFTFRDGLQSVHHDSVPVEIRTKITHHRKAGDLIVKLLDREIKSEVFGTLNYGAVKRACGNLLDQAKNVKEVGIYLRNYRILKEEIGITKVKVSFIEYKFSGKIYQAWIYGDGVITKYQFEKENLDFSSLLPRLIEKGYVFDDFRVNPEFLSLDDEFKSWFPKYKEDQFKLIEAILFDRSRDNEIWAPVSPISEFNENLFNNAQELFKRKEYSLALDSLDKAIEMFDKKEHKELHKKIVDIINSQYLSGAIIGGTIFPIIGNISGIVIGFIFQNGFSIRTSRRRFFSAFWASFIVNGFLLIILSIILSVK